ncbi:MAG: hypothetical protein R3225_08310 [Halofilum sp. (in: g-proteobacteria)]|nr:hypothetical protein [Halofilum sp. (in: g-proteobacteria)]
MVTGWMRIAGCGLLLVLAAAPAQAQDPDQALDDVTMEVVDESDADEGEYVDEILLPGSASPVGRGESAFGIGRANEARDRAREEGREFGKDTADEARRRGRDAGNAARAVNGSGGRPEDLPVEVQ